MDMSWLKIPKIGKPTVMTPQILDRLKQAFLMGCTDSEACLFAEIHTGTLYNYQTKHPEYALLKAEYKQNPILLARTEVIKGLRKDSAHALKVMERLSKDYKQKQEVDINSDSFESILTKLKQGGGE